MLKLDRRLNESFVIADEIKITVVRIERDKGYALIDFDVPEGISVSVDGIPSRERMALAAGRSVRIHDEDGSFSVVFRILGIWLHPPSRCDWVSCGFIAPRDIPIDREEIHLAKLSGLKPVTEAREALNA